MGFKEQVVWGLFGAGWVAIIGIVCIVIYYFDPDLGPPEFNYFWALMGLMAGWGYLSFEAGSENAKSILNQEKRS